MFVFDWMYLLFALPGLLLSLWASWKVKSSFARYAGVPSRRGISGAELAHRLLVEHGAPDVQIEGVHGSLVDHYDPRNRVLRLSSDVYSSRSISALGVAAHEAGHAIQHAQGYGPIHLRAALVPVANLGSGLGFWLFFIGALLVGAMPKLGNGMIIGGLGLFSFFVLFTLVTLPVEFDASRRAILALEQGGYLDEEELVGARRVLRAAAWTYVAAALSAIMQLLYLLLRSGLLGGRSSDD
jgi:Zn-dependent membrane protease YugP